LLRAGDPPAPLAGGAGVEAPLGAALSAAVVGASSQRLEHPSAPVALVHSIEFMVLMTAHFPFPPWQVQENAPPVPPPLMRAVVPCTVTLAPSGTGTVF